MFKTSRLSTMILALAAALGLSAAAPAQFGEAAGFSEMMAPYFLRRDMQFFAEELDLDEGQKAVVESLFWDYEDGHNESRKRMLTRLTEMRENIENLDRGQILQQVFQPFEDRAEEWADMREQLLSDVQVILNAEQLQRWDDFRFKLRRLKELPKGRMSGESLDLVRLARDVNVPQGVAAGLIGEYVTQIDGALRRREQLIQESQLAMMHSIRDEDPATALHIYESQIDARVAIRDINDTYLDAIANAISGDLGDEFRRTGLEDGYPRVFRPTAIERLFDEARNIDGLPEETILAIDNLQVALVAELDIVNGQILTLMRAFEPEEARYRARSFAMRDGQRPEKPVDPTRSLFRDRDAIGYRYADMLRDLLSDEQFRSLRGAQRFLRQRNANEESFNADTPPPPGKGKAEKKRAANDAREARRRSLRDK